MHFGRVEAPSVHVDLARHEVTPTVGGIERQGAIGEKRATSAKSLSPGCNAQSRSRIRASIAIADG